MRFRRRIAAFLRNVRATRRVRRVRLAHVLGPNSVDEEELVRQAVQLCRGDISLRARLPINKAAVSLAETILNASPRPVYTFLGLLHPDLGKVGVIFGRGLLQRCLQGVSRCDSGGLAGRVKGFGCINEPDVRQELLRLSYPLGSASLDDWARDFRLEITWSYPDNAAGYVRGDTPEYSRWNDVRRRVIEHARSADLMDRRLWSWEVRLGASPAASDIECLALSPEAHKILEYLRRKGLMPPDRITILSGHVGPSGVTMFKGPAFEAALLGERT